MKLRAIAVLIAAGALSAIFAAPSYGALARSRLVTTFEAPPVSVTSPPGEERLLFVVEQTGRIWVLDNEVKAPTPFLDVSSRVLVTAEGGLLSIAFAPDYATSRRFYIFYTNKNRDIEIVEYRRMAANRKRADPATRRLVLSIPHRDSGFHYGGQLQFGSDGLLYISTGDGGGFTAPKGGLARDLNSLLGKILRINPRQHGAQAYRVPPDNPYVGISNRRPEIYAYGLRNPWRFSFFADGRVMAISDEGEDRQDEINFWTTARVKGMNFGWPQFEGNLFYGGPPGFDRPKPPMYAHDHTEGRCAVVGGYVVRDSDIPALEGRYVFGDLCNGRIMSMIADVNNQTPKAVLPVGIVARELTSFGVGPNGAIYFTQGSGQLRRLIPVPSTDTTLEERP